jgi:hypothetical protein
MTAIQVKVTVKDIDDNDPVFTQTNITTGKLFFMLLACYQS